MQPNLLSLEKEKARKERLKLLSCLIRHIIDAEVDIRKSEGEVKQNGDLTEIAVSNYEHGWDRGYRRGLMAAKELIEEIFSHPTES